MTKRSPAIPVPYPPFMAFAPLDVWARLLLHPRPCIPLRYWPRVMVGLLISTVVTVVTLPERLLLAAWIRLRPSGSSPMPGPVFILGYYRSGTTHLQFLMDRDPNLFSPKWYQALPAQGFVLSWNLIRFFMLPFTARTRPQDNVAFGSDIPAEDDFALNNWGLVSTLPGRIMVPREHRFYDRFHDLKGLSERELSRWRRIQYGVVRKISLLAGRRRVLLKTPSHTAKVAALLDLFKGTTGPKFIHISRHPHSVLRSNLAMLQVLNDMYGLQEQLPADELEQNLLHEYLATEQNYLASQSLIPPGSVAEIRLQDLQADPVGEIKRVYAELGLPYTEEFEQRLLDYLDATSDYKPNKHSGWTAEQERRLAPALEPLIKLFRHEQPTVPPLPAPAPAHMAPAARRIHRAKAGCLSLLTAAIGVGLWVGLARLTGFHWDVLMWPVGIAVGTVALRAARRGSRALALWSAGVTLLCLGGAAVLAPGSVALGRHGVPFWSDPWTLDTFFWTFMGMGCAYRTATRPWV